MKLIPLLYSTPMVQAIQEGRKTKTRRMVKGLATEANEDGTINWEFKNNRSFNATIEDLNDNFLGIIGDCPYGKPGDILWVRETFTIIDWWEDSKAVQIMYEDGETSVKTLTPAEWEKFDNWADKSGRKPSLFLFKSLSRIFLKVTDVRVERLHDITENDAIAEGINEIYNDAGEYSYSGFIKHYHHSNWLSPVYAFQELWQSINGEESWNANPWVWVVSFERTENPSITAFDSNNILNVARQ